MSESDEFVQIVTHIPRALCLPIWSSWTLFILCQKETVKYSKHAALYTSLTISVVNVGCQEGGTDCGLYAIAMAYDLCAGVDPVSRKYMQSEMRNSLYNCIGTKWLKPFWSNNRDVTNRNFECQRTIFNNLECQWSIFEKCWHVHGGLMSPDLLDCHAQAAAAVPLPLIEFK